MSLTIPDSIVDAARIHPYPLLFATVSGAHLYGFPSADSDWDLRGVHILPIEQVIGLKPYDETVETTTNEDIELDLVTHDVKKFISLLLKPNGYVLEQLLSPIVIVRTPKYEELASLSSGCITKHHVHHYIGFAQNQWAIFSREDRKRVKPLLYAFRVVLTGIHLMRTGEVVANLAALNEIYPLPYIPELMERKINGAEKEALDGDIDVYEKEFRRLLDELRAAGDRTTLPDAPTVREELNDLLIRTRLSR